VTGVGVVVVEVEGVVVDADAEAGVGELVEGDALVKKIFYFFSVVCDRFGDGASPSGTGFVVGFEVCDEEACGFVFLVEGFDCGGEVVRSVGDIFERADGVVEGGGSDAVVVVFAGEFGFMVAAGLFVCDEGFEEAGCSFILEPVAGDGGLEVEGVGEVVVAGDGEVIVVLGVFEDDVPLEVSVLFVEGVAVAEVGVAVEQFVDGGFAVGVDWDFVGGVLEPFAEAGARDVYGVAGFLRFVASMGLFVVGFELVVFMVDIFQLIILRKRNISTLI